MLPMRTTALVRRQPVLAVLAVLAVGALGLLGPAPPAAAGPAWVWPLAGPHVVSRPFGLGATPYAAGHRGADLPGEPGTAVRTAGAGRVSYAGLLAGRGVVVVVHGALRTTYEPVTPVVSTGQPVALGQQIATLDAGHEGCPVAACLHWGLLWGEQYLDPVALVEAGPVRLLPRDGPAAGPRAPPAPGRDARAAPGAAVVAAQLSAPAVQALPVMPPASPGHRTAVAGTALALLTLGGSALSRLRRSAPAHP